MKQSTQLLVAAFLTLLISASVFASDKSAKELMAANLEIAPKANHGFELAYTSDLPANFEVHIYNSEGELVFKEAITSEKSFVRPFPLNGMASDKYRVEIMDEDGFKLKEGIVSHQADFDANIWTIPNSNRYMVVIPQCIRGISLSIYNEKGERIHSDRLKGTNGVSKIYDLSKMDGEEFTFKIAKNFKTLKEVTL